MKHAFPLKSGFGFCIVIFLLLSVYQIHANVAMPGFFSPGAENSFKLFFPADSIHLDKVQMESERISILLYPGFAVVKGEYWMKNLSDEAVNLKTGYPVNSYLDKNAAGVEGGNYVITIDSLARLRVLIDGSQLEISDVAIIDPNDFEEKNWHLWETVFPANTTTKIEVYFLVNTNTATVLQGYDKNYVNGFIYILESGRSWAGNIKKGRIGLRMMDGLSWEDIEGLRPDSTMLADKEANVLFYFFENLEPAPKDNLLLRYGKKMDEFDFDSILANSQKFYNLVDNFSKEDWEKYSKESIEAGNPFEVHTFLSFGQKVLLVLIGLGLLFIGAIAGIVSLFKRKRK